MLKFALVGCGRVSRKHIDAIMQLPGAKLAALCDIDEEKKQRQYEYTGKGIPFYKHYNEMLEKEDIDIVNILTPSGLHAQHTIDIVRNFQKHIIVEKPMCLRLEDADAMINVCRENGVRLFIIKQNRFNLPVQKLRQAIDEDRFGKLFLGTVRVRWCRHQSYYDMDDWRGTWAMDGGVLTNQASHHIDLLIWMLGEPVSVIAKTATFLSKIEVEDTGLAIIKFKSGALGLIEATTAVRPKDLESSLSIMGEKGSAIIGGFAVNKMEVWNLTDESEENNKMILEKYKEMPPDVYGYGHKSYIQHVMDCIVNNKKALVDGNEGRKSLELINAIYESAQTGKEFFLGQKPRFSLLGARG